MQVEKSLMENFSLSLIIDSYFKDLERNLPEKDRKKLK